MKQKRHALIRELIEKYDIETQEELRARLENAGYYATQATISRDIKDLRLVKVLNEKGIQKYVFRLNSDSSGSIDKLMKVFSEACVSVDLAVNIVVVKTLPGMAHAAASAIDALERMDIVGSIAGDDCIFVACRTENSADELIKRFRTWIGK